MIASWSVRGDSVPQVCRKSPGKSSKLLPLIAIGLPLATMAIWLRSRRAPTPLDKAATSNLCGFVGTVLGVLIALGFAWSRYIRPADNSDLREHAASFVGKNISVQDHVIWLSSYEKEGLALFMLDNNVTVQTTRLHALPTRGQAVHTFGRAYSAFTFEPSLDESASSRITLNEQFRSDRRRRIHRDCFHSAYCRGRATTLFSMLLELMGRAGPLGGRIRALRARSPFIPANVRGVDADPRTAVSSFRSILTV